MNKSRLLKEFGNPSNELGPAPFWFLNEKLDEKELTWQIKEMKKNGLSGYVMHARYGLEVPYLSEEWFKKIGHIIEESDKLGMDAIIYDEVDWPSGMSGTRVLDEHPEYAMTYLDISWVKCDDKKSIEVVLEDGNVIAVTGARFVKGQKQEDFRFKARGLKNLKTFVKDGKLKIGNLKDIDIIFIFIEKELSAYHPKTAFPQPVKPDCPFHQPHKWDWYFPYGKYVDLLNPDAIDYFLETTHEEYKKRFKDHFGKAITKIFTDEPGFYTIMREKYSAVQWSSIFAGEFKKEFGYSIVDYLPALVADIGDKTYKVRNDFWKKLTTMFEINYVKKLNDWCERNGLQLMGHFRLCNPFLIWQMQYQGNVMNDMRSMHIPGIDSLDNVEGDLNLRWGIDENVWQIPNKIVSSVAHQYGKRRVLSESFALGGWKERLEDIKILTDWQCMMGINYIVPHAFHYSLTSQRKRECPPSEFYQNPMWDNYNYYSKYLTRTSTIITDSTHVADIALLYPMESLWAEYATGTTERFPWNISDDFSYITDKLLRVNLDYDIVGQDIFEDCKIEDGKLKIRDEKYSILVIPPMTTLRDSVAKKIIQFIKKGGKVLGLSLLPYKNNEGKSLKTLNDFFVKEFNIKEDELLSNYKNGKDNVEIIESKNFCGENMSLIKCGPLYKSNPIDLIEKAIEKMINRDININVLNNTEANVYYSHWKKDGKDFYYIINSDEKPYELEISLRNIGKPYLWSPETGQAKQINIYRVENNRLILQYDPKELESNFIVLENETIEENRIVKTNLEVLSIDREDSNGSVKLIRKNEEGETYIDILRDGETKHIPINIPGDKIKSLSENWVINRKDPNVLVLNNWKMMQGFSEGTGWFNMLGGTVFLESSFCIKDFGKELKGIFDRVPEPNEIEINGEIIKDFKASTYLDHQMKEADLKSFVKVGKNKIRIKFELKERAFQGKTGIDPIEIMYDPVFIVGDFKLMPDDMQENGYIIEKEESEIQVGSWTKQGYPYFKGCIELSQRIYLEDDLTKGKKIFLKSDDLREIAELSINGSIVGLRPWQPYIFDVTDYVKAGENLVTIKLWNTLTNLLDLKIFESGMIKNPYFVSKEIKTVKI